MRTLLVLISVALFPLTTLVAQSSSPRTLAQFNGRQVTITEAEIDTDGFPKGPASVCIEGPPQKQCYTAPKSFGRDPKVTLVQLKAFPALLFSAASGGVSGFTIHLALLRPGAGKDLENLFFGNVSLSNVGQFAFWANPSVSDAPFFVTADYIWGPDESHYSAHRYILSAYLLSHSSDSGTDKYGLEDRYMSFRTYNSEEDEDILGREKPEILARLQRVRLERSTRTAPTPKQ